MGKKVLIIGAGIGGLATALRLARKGYQVEILEKNPQAGGRVNRIQKDGFTFDTGPSFFSMSYEFEQFARDCNITLPFRYHPVDPLYTVNFRNNAHTYLLYRDISRLAAQFADIEPDFTAKMERYLAKSREIFDSTIDIVVRQNFNSLRDYFSQLMKVNPALLPVLFSSFWRHICRYFDSDDARQIISLVSFFLGRTPFNTSAVYSLLSYTEFCHDGYFNVEGGMYKIIEGMVNELKKAGVKLTYNSEITGAEVQGNDLKFLTDPHGRHYTAGLYVINADAAAFRGLIFNRKAYSPRHLDRMGWTMGVMTLYIGLDCKLPQVQLHNYYLGNNFREYAGKVFHTHETIEKPYYYVNVISRQNPDCAPAGCEALLFVVPVSDLRYKPHWDDRDEIADSIIADFSTRIGQNICPHIISRTVYTPLEWESRFNLYRGSGLGLAHDMLQVGAFRPRNYDEVFPNVFYVGASTVPGTGLPMCIISSRLVVERIEQKMAD